MARFPDPSNKEEMRIYRELHIKAVDEALRKKAERRKNTPPPTLKERWLYCVGVVRMLFIIFGFGMGLMISFWLVVETLRAIGTFLFNS